MRRRVLIYGATGYTGRLIAEHARHLRRSLIVAGRTAHRVEELASQLGVAGRVFSLDDPEILDEALATLTSLSTLPARFRQTARPADRIVPAHDAPIISTLPANSRCFATPSVTTTRPASARSWSCPVRGWVSSPPIAWRCTSPGCSPMRSICGSGYCGPICCRGARSAQRSGWPIPASAFAETGG